MKLLYLSAHAILEYDELKLFEELGIDYFSMGSYIDPQKPIDGIRPALSKEVDKDLLDSAPPRDKMTKEFIDKFDVILIMHVPEWVTSNWELFKGKRVIWRSIGQSTPKVEAKLQECRQDGLEVVRYSPAEMSIENSIGGDAVIRFYKDPNEFHGYNGVDKKVITFSQDMKHRAEFCNYDAFLEITKNLPARIYGPKNDNAGELNGGFLTYPEMKQKMRDSRVYLYTGTQPASYTLNFIEAFMTGIPIVALGPKYANSMVIAGPHTYEIPDFIQNGVNGFISNDLEELRGWVKEMLSNRRAAARIGEMGRQTAIELFGKDKVRDEWAQFLKI